MQKHSCITCARRKIKCDRQEPCSNCLKSRVDCLYLAPPPSSRHRKRLQEDHLLGKLAEYEALLRDNDIQFQPLGKAVDQGVRGQDSDPQVSCVPNSSTLTPALVDEPGNTLGNSCSWFALPKELREPAFERLKPQTEVWGDEKLSVHAGEENEIVALLLHLPDATSLLREVHPQPEQIYKLWKLFAEKVNPLTKVIHTPTLQQRILEASWNLDNVSDSLQAVMFSVYALAVCSISPSECLEMFGEAKSALLIRYRSAAAQALGAAGLQSTRELEVLQAFVLYLLIDPRSEKSGTAVALAIRIGQKMELHRTGCDSSMPVFDQEMRLRVWWQIMVMDSRMRRKMLGMTFPLLEYGNVSLPTNANDVDLHPTMGKRPSVENSIPTDMIFCLLNYEVMHYARSSMLKPGHGSNNNSPYDIMRSNDPEVTAEKLRIMSNLERIFEEKYLRHCDPGIPLHRISTIMGRLTIFCERFRCLHPRHQPDNGRHMSPTHLETLFEASIHLVQLELDLQVTGYSSHLLEHVLGVKAEPLVYMISELRYRISGGLVSTAWSLVERVFVAHSNLLRQQDRFCNALADLTISAWQARNVEPGNVDSNPDYIQALVARRGDVCNADGMSVGDDVDMNLIFQLESTQDDAVEWAFWNEIPLL